MYQICRRVKRSTTLAASVIFAIYATAKVISLADGMYDIPTEVDVIAIAAVVALTIISIHMWWFQANLANKESITSQVRQVVTEVVDERLSAVTEELSALRRALEEDTDQFVQVDLGCQARLVTQIRRVITEELEGPLRAMTDHAYRAAMVDRARAAIPAQYVHGANVLQLNRSGEE